MSIFVVRHAETVDNAARVLQLPSTPLSRDGHSQAQRLAERVAEVGVARILASDFVRAAETAAHVTALTGVEAEFEPDLRERNFGDLCGTPYTALTIDPFAPDYIPPKGESWAAFYARVAVAWNRIAFLATETRGNLLVVTHGLVCRALVERHFALLPGESPPNLWGNAAVTEVDTVAPWTVRRMNCMVHLANER